jgi:PKD repeat protein
VTILGDGFDPPVQVIFGSGTAGSFTGVEAAVQSVTRGRITLATPAATGFGSANANSTVAILVRNTTSGFVTVAPAAFTYGVSDIFISSVSPNTGPHQGGTRVLINGQGFDEPVAVGLAGVGAEIISVTGTQVVVRSNPPLVSSCTNITGDVTLTNIENATGATASGAWTYLVQDPVISNINPASRRFNDPTPFVVTFTGFGFEEPVRVKFGDQVASNVVVNSPTSLTVTVPDNFTGFATEPCDENGGGGSGTRDIPTAVDVVVENLLTTCTDTFQGGFTFIPQGLCENDPEPAPVAPIANFTFTQNGADGMFIVNFADASTGDITTRSWDFGGLGASAAIAPTFDFGSAGIRTVTLTVTGPGGSNSISQDVNVLP